MASIKQLGKNPSFKLKVGLPQAGEPDFDVTFTFKYRTKDQLIEFNKSLAGRMDVDVILDMAEGWDCEEPFDRESIEYVCQRSGGAPVAILYAYRNELVKVKLGN